MAKEERIPRPNVFPFRTTDAENRAMRAKARAHQVDLAELVRRAIAAFPDGPRRAGNPVRT